MLCLANSTSSSPKHTICLVSAFPESTVLTKENKSIPEQNKTPYSILLQSLRYLAK